MPSPPEQETVTLMRCACGRQQAHYTVDRETMEPLASCPLRPFEFVPLSDLEAAEAERDRLRKRTHEIQEDGSRKRAGLESQVDSHRASMERAREAVAEFRADWTSDPPSQERGGFWRYTSKNTRDALACLIEQLEVAEEALRECVRLSGADVSDGFPTQPPLHEFAVREVHRLRKEADDE